MTTTLFGLVDVRDALNAALEDTQGELTPDLDAALSQWEGDFKDKVENYALLITELRDTGKLAREKAEAFVARAKAREALADRLAARLQQGLEDTGTKKVVGTLKTVWLQASNPKVETLTAMDEPELRNIAQFAPRYIRRTESWALDKNQVLEDHKAGALDPEVGKRLKVVQTVGLRIR